LPGEQSHRTYEERVAVGVPIHAELRATLDALAESVGVAPLGA
jgi:L-2-hydroxycarboxylate dehydrogenase (NAD+)